MLLIKTKLAVKVVGYDEFVKIRTQIINYTRNIKIFSEEKFTSSIVSKAGTLLSLVRKCTFKQMNKCTMLN